MNQPTILLLHGLGANGAVWHDLAELLPDRTVIAPDLPGHATGPTLPGYDFDALSDAVAAALDPQVRYDILGHSFGGAIGAALADPRHGLSIERVVALGVKVGWTEEEERTVAKLGTKPVTWFDTREEALNRYLKVAGLVGKLGRGGLPDEEHPTSLNGVVESEGRWRTTMDPAVVAAGKPDMVSFLTRAGCPVLMVRGEHDEMSTAADLADLTAKTGSAPHVTLPGLGHNAHVEDPRAVAAMCGWVTPSQQPDRAAVP